ncbi:lyase family protein [Nocardia abscessus]|uniref:lyase family protein n=1 Tax=Nocardia abscessus TaxID=120957 RepID=UPI002457CFA5|nr:lyase family protein [Nocardia abscessus]
MSLLSPGSHRVAALFSDEALIATMLRVEVAWSAALADTGIASTAQAAAVARAAASGTITPDTLAAATESAGNPVAPLVSALRAAVGDSAAAALVHRGLTSQDVLDTALIVLARTALDRLSVELRASGRALARLAREHRDTVMAGRTLGRYAVPITAGLKAAQWLAGIQEALGPIEAARAALPVQCGGAAGTLALLGELTADPPATVAAFAHRLGLADPGLPWHTRRTPITTIGHVVVTACDVLGVLAADVLALSRPEVNEIREGSAPGRGGSSTMPHKRNPVLSVLVRSAALRAPQLGAQLPVAAAGAVDERPDGAWHAEWEALRGLLTLATTAAAQAAELAAGLEVDTEVIARHVADAAGDLLAERGTPGDPAAYTGSAGAFVDHVLSRWAAIESEETA